MYEAAFTFIDKGTGGLQRWQFRSADTMDLDGRFDGFIIGDPARASRRITTPPSFGESRGRTLLTNLEDQLGQSP